MINGGIAVVTRAFRRPSATLAVIRTTVRRRAVLLATTKVELRKKYSGSLLGPLWIVLLPAMLLGIYLIIYLVIFPARLANLSGLSYALFIFSGLVPYLGLLEVIGTGTVSVKQNIHLVKNIMMPIELIPIRSAMIGMVGELVSLAVLLALLAANHSLTWHVLWLPIVLALQFSFLLGIVYVLSAIAVSLPDISYVIGLILTLLMFVSPIGYVPETLGGGLVIPLVYLNPVAYMIEAFRDCLYYGRFPSALTTVVFVALSLASLIGGIAFFTRFKNVLIDYE
ncbi:MAG: ABC transporter permease [Roseiarcus sp.]|jgi:lipopolysaccharide transport system permease protein